MQISRQKIGKGGNCIKSELLIEPDNDLKRELSSKEIYNKYLGSEKKWEITTMEEYDKYCHLMMLAHEMEYKREKAQSKTESEK